MLRTPTAEDVSMCKVTLQRTLGAAALLLICLTEAPRAPAAEDPQTEPAPSSYWPMITGAQYTYVLQHEDALDAPYSGRLSLGPQADTQPTHTMGLYLGWAPLDWRSSTSTLRSSWAPA